MIHDAADLLGAQDGLDCLLAVEEARIVGVVVFTPLGPDGHGWIHSIGVVYERQSNGIGTDLKRNALDVCTREGAASVVSHVDRNNMKMQKVNQKLGISFEVDPQDGKFFLYAAPLEAAPDD